MEKKQNKTTLIIAILALYFFMIANNGVVAVLQNISQKYPDVPYSNITQVITLPGFFLVAFNLISGNIAGKKIGYKTLAIIGIILFAIAGSIPAVVGGFAVLLVSRALLGVAQGLIYPLGNALVVKLFPEDEQRTIIGYGTMAMNVGLMVLQILVGMLIGKGVDYIWYAHLIALIPLLAVILWLKEPAREAFDQAETTAKSSEKLPGCVYLIAVCLFLFPFFYGALTSGLSGVVIGEGIGSASDASVAMTLNTVAGIIIGLLLGKMLAKCGKLTITIGWVLCALSLFLGAYGKTTAVYTASAILMGIGMNISYPCLLIETNMVVPASKIAAGSALSFAAFNLGVALTSYYFGAVASASGNSSMRLPMLIGGVGCIVLIIFHVFVQKSIDTFLGSNK